MYKSLLVYRCLDRFTDTITLLQSENSHQTQSNDASWKSIGDKITSKHYNSYVSDTRGNKTYAFANSNDASWKSIGDKITSKHYNSYVSDTRGNKTYAFANCLNSDEFCSKCENAAEVIVKQGFFTFKSFYKKAIKLCQVEAEKEIEDLETFMSDERIIEQISTSLLDDANISGSVKAAYNQCTAYLFKLYALRIRLEGDEVIRMSLANELLSALITIQPALDLITFSTIHDRKLKAMLDKFQNVKSICQMGGIIMEKFTRLKSRIDGILDSVEYSSTSLENGTFRDYTYISNVVHLPIDFIDMDNALCEDVLLWMIDTYTTGLWSDTWSIASATIALVITRFLTQI